MLWFKGGTHEKKNWVRLKNEERKRRNRKVRKGGLENGMKKGKKKDQNGRRD